MKLCERGLTLVEVVVSLGIASVAGILLMVIILNSTNVSLDQSLKVEQGVDINNALSQMKLLIKQSGGVIAYYPDAMSPTYTTSATQLILNIPSLDPVGQLIQNKFDVFVFYKSGSQLKMKSFPDVQSSRKSADQMLSNKIESVDFKYFDSANPPQEISPASSTRVKITLTLKQQKGLGFETSTATAEANIRN